MATTGTACQFRVLEARTQQHIQDQLDIRKIVFVDEQGVPVENEFEVLDEEMLQQPTHNDAVVLVAYKDDKPAGCMRLLRKDFGFKLGRFAVLAEHRGKGCGRQLMHSAHQVIGDTPVLVHVQVQVQGMYEKFGYALVDGGEVFYEEGIAHIKMSRGSLPTSV